MERRHGAANRNAKLSLSATAHQVRILAAEMGTASPINGDILPTDPMILELPPSDSRHKTEDSGGAW